MDFSQKNTLFISIFNIQNLDVNEFFLERDWSRLFFMFKMRARKHAKYNTLTLKEKLPVNLGGFCSFKKTRLD
jgi:hypothetical protein